MNRPWYTYLLLFVGSLALLGAAFGPMVGVVSRPPGAVIAADGRLRVQPDSPLAGAGARSGDRWISGDTVDLGGKAGSSPRPLRWKRGIPRSGSIRVSRAGRPLWLQVRPAPPVPLVRLAWSLIGLLNVALTSLALALFWQRPRDGRAVLLGLVLLAAPVFGFPNEPRLLALVLAAHFFTIFPEPPRAEGPPRRWRGWLGIYLPFLLLGLVGTSLSDQGRTAAATALFNLLALGYGSYGLARVLLRWRGAPPERRPVIRTLAVAAGAILAAVLVGIPDRLWVISDQFVPAHFLPALLFSAAVGHLVFRLRALEVRLTARRTLQYLLARWTLGTLFLIPGFLLVWRFGQLSVTHEAIRPNEVL
ncbi:MAG TPA: hypothetical protein VFU47_10785, partial [Armatimonadota bacterium]|nr:hypothetical protein [Armatimonadota bacterium]